MAAQPADPNQLLPGESAIAIQKTPALSLQPSPNAESQRPEVAPAGQRRDLKTVLFSTLTPPIINGPVQTPPQLVRRRSVGCVNLRRSARLAVKRRTGSMMHRAQEALAHKLGTLPKDQPLTDEVLKHYLATFKAPLP